MALQANGCPRRGRTTEEAQDKLTVTSWGRGRRASSNLGPQSSRHRWPQEAVPGLVLGSRWLPCCLQKATGANPSSPRPAQGGVCSSLLPCSPAESRGPCRPQWDLPGPGSCTVSPGRGPALGSPVKCRFQAPPQTQRSAAFRGAAVPLTPAGVRAARLVGLRCDHANIAQGPRRPWGEH